MRKSRQRKWLHLEAVHLDVSLGSSSQGLAGAAVKFQGLCACFHYFRILLPLQIQGCKVEQNLKHVGVDFFLFLLPLPFHHTQDGFRSCVMVFCSWEVSRSVAFISQTPLLQLQQQHSPQNQDKFPFGSLILVDASTSK